QDAARAAVPRGRRQRDDRMSVQRPRRTSNEVDLTPDAREELAHERIGGPLSPEGGGKGGGDRNPGPLAGGPGRGAGELTGTHLDRGVVVPPVIERSRAHQV